MNADRARAALSYDPASGALTWREKGPKHAAGGRAGCLNGAGYLVVWLDGKLHLAHRLAWLIQFGAWPEQIDHRNGDRLDNRLANLRDVSNAVNAQNKRRARSDSKTGVQGVYLQRGRIVSKIKANGREVYLGSFPTVESAGAAFVAAKRDLHKGCTL